MKKVMIIFAAISALLIAWGFSGIGHAEEGCTIGEYQGAPIEMCPPQEPDPTNCYTGDYQGAPIEICMPTGWEPDPSWTYKGEPIQMHVSKDYVPPVEESDPVVTTTQVPVTVPAPTFAPAPEPEYAREELVSIVNYLSSFLSF